MKPLRGGGKAGAKLGAMVAASLALLAACGGGDADDQISRADFDIVSAEPAVHVGRLYAAPDSGASLELRPPDGFSAVPYCLLRYTALRHAKGGRYLLGAAYATTDRRVLVVVLSNRETSWQVQAFHPPAQQAVVDAPGRRLVLRELLSTQGMQVGWEAKLSGEAVLPPAATGSEACAPTPAA